MARLLPKTAGANLLVEDVDRVEACAEFLLKGLQPLDDHVKAELREMGYNLIGEDRPFPLILVEVGDVYSAPKVSQFFFDEGIHILAVGFPVALWFAWTYEITPVGLKRAADVDQTQSIVYKTGQKLNAAVAVLVVQVHASEHGRAPFHPVAS